MGWRQALRSIEADTRRAERNSAKQRRQLQLQQAARAKMEEKAQAAHDVSLYENYVELITSLHRDCAEPVHWAELRDCSAPIPKEPDTRRTEQARAQLWEYSPGFFDRLFGTDKKKRAALEQVLSDAIDYDVKGANEQRRTHDKAVDAWKSLKELAAEVLTRSPSAYKSAIERYAPFEELESLGIRAAMPDIQSEAIVVDLHLEDPETVPRDEVKLSAGGKLTTKDLTDAKYWTLYQDFACSAALRAASEAFALLPIKRVVANVFTKRLNTSTGHQESDCIFAVHIYRAVLAGLNLQQADASDSTKNFQTRMKFKKATGFERVDMITLNDQWVTT